MANSDQKLTTEKEVNHINHGSQAGRRIDPTRDPAGIKLWDCVCGAITIYVNGKFATWREAASPKASEGENAQLQGTPANIELQDDDGHSTEGRAIPGSNSELCWKCRGLGGHYGMCVECRDVGLVPKGTRDSYQKPSQDGAEKVSEFPPNTFCMPNYGGKQVPQWMLFFEDRDRGYVTFDNEKEAREAFARATDHWNCTLFEPVRQQQSASAPAPQEADGVELPDYITKHRYSFGKDAEGFSTGSLVQSDYGQWVSSIAVHMLHKELRTALAQLAQAKKDERKWQSKCAKQSRFQSIRNSTIRLGVELLNKEREKVAALKSQVEEWKEVYSTAVTQLNEAKARIAELEKGK